MSTENESKQPLTPEELHLALMDIATDPGASTGGDTEPNLSEHAAEFTERVGKIIEKLRSGRRPTKKERDYLEVAQMYVEDYHDAQGSIPQEVGGIVVSATVESPDPADPDTAVEELRSELAEAEEAEAQINSAQETARERAALFGVRRWESTALSQAISDGWTVELMVPDPEISGALVPAIQNRSTGAVKKEVRREWYLGGGKFAKTREEFIAEMKKRSDTEAAVGA